MSELQLHRAAMLAELGRVFFELILCIVIIVLAFAKCFPKPNEPNDPDDDCEGRSTNALLELLISRQLVLQPSLLEWNGYGKQSRFCICLGQHQGIKVRGPGWGSNPPPAIQK